MKYVVKQITRVSKKGVGNMITIMLNNIYSQINLS